jgi:hypothetical protein
MSSIGTVAMSKIGCYTDEGASIENWTASVVFDLGCRGFDGLNSRGFHLPSSFLGLHASKFVPEFGISVAF